MPTGHECSDKHRISELIMTRHYLQSDHGRDWLATTNWKAPPLKEDFLFAKPFFQSNGDLESIRFRNYKYKP